MEHQITKIMVVLTLIMPLFVIGISTYFEMYQNNAINNETIELLLITGRIGLWVIFPVSLFGYYIERNKKKVCEFIYNKEHIN